MISELDILNLHSLSIGDFGGSLGLRDRNLLLSALARPFHTFGGQELYNTPFEKAAALGESLIINHPFIDGNKRTSFLAMLAMLMEFGYEFRASQDECYNFVISMSKGEKGMKEISIWLEHNSIKGER